MKQLIPAFLLTFLATFASAQTVPFPPNPGNTNQLENWGYTNDLTNWDTSPFLPFIYNNLKFRLMPPNGVTYNSSTKVWTNANPAKKYPLILFFHGNGEQGTDNNKQLANGGQRHRDAILSGEFPGFAFYPQSVTYDQAKTMLDKLIATLPIDINQIYVHGLSGGGGRAWTFAITYPTLVAAAFPMSASDAGAQTNTMLYMPLREAQGALDTNPVPSYPQQTVDWMNNNGGHLEYFLLPGVGHGTWNYMYQRADFFSWFLARKKNTIMVRFDRNLICPEATVSVDMGFTPGFTNYEWRKDGVLMSGQNAYKIIATEYGSYTGRILNSGVWSDWSDPVVVGPKGVTNTPPIVTNGLKSIVLPAPDGSATTELALPAGYKSYSWKNAGNTTVSTAMVFTSVPVGTYTASANEINGCQTIPSPPFNVVSASGPNNPDAIDDFIGYATSASQVTLGWADKPSPNYNETGFEVYRAQATGGPYTLIAITAPDVVGYVDNNLSQNTTYFYKIRPVNQYSAAPVSNVVSVLTQVDNIAPTPPANLVSTGVSDISASLSWTASTDNVGVYRYDVYKNGVKVLTTQSTSATVYNLTAGTLYNFIVKARDVTGNNSPSSNLLTIVAGASGLEYRYYETSTTLTLLPNFTALNPTAVGYSSVIDLSVRKRDTNFAMYWSGMINIPVAGTYTFVTNSDDGSKLYIGSYDEANLVVNNDGGHGAKDAEGNKTFAAPGRYPIVVTYFQGTGGFNMGIYWKNSANGVVAKTLIPASAFVSTASLGGSAPAAPGNLVATPAAFDKINLSWADVSNNENGFRIYRSLSNTGPFAPVANVGANVTTYQDVALTGNTTYYYRVTSYGDFGESKLSTQVPRGLSYNYYEAADMASLSQLGSLAPVKSGTSSIFDIALRDRNENMALRWTGKINITVAATYTFYASSDDGSTLSIDGVQVVANDTDGAAKEKSGTKALTVGWHDIEVSWRKHLSPSSRLTISYARPGVGKSVINATNSTAFFYGTEINAKTLPVPAVPATPANVQITNPQPTTLALTWQDVATDETGYQILRSYKTNTNYVTYRNLPANSASFQDPGLFANGLYFYKVVAVGASGNSTSAEVSMSTANNAPVLSQIQDLAVKFGTVVNVDVLATDLDNDPITFNVSGLPSFATFTDHTDGSGNIRLAPSSSQLGQYPIVVTAMDNHSGVSTSRFTITVTDKAAPVILPITNPTVAEGKTTAVQIQATSDFGDASIQYSFAGLPSFAVPSINGGLCSIQVSPDYIDAGTYSVDVTVTDNLASTTKTFLITVSSVDPNTMVSVNIVSSTNASAPWNNMTGTTMSSLLDASGATTTLGVQFQVASMFTNTQGAVTGNNSGAFPDNVIKDYAYFGFAGAPETANVKISGLDVSRKYDLGFFGSTTFTGVPDNGSTLYKVGTTTVSLRTQNNKYNIATIPGNTPAADGSITFTISKAAGSPVAYINALTIKSLYKDGTVPAPPRNVTATFSNSNVNVTWIDAPFNEDGFDVYRSDAQAGPFSKVNSIPVVANATTFTDSTVVTGQTYYYEVKAFNAYGESVFSNIASTVLPVIAPKITITGNTPVAPSGFGMVSVATSTDAVLAITNAPSFAYLSPSSPSTTDIVLLPGASDPGNYQLTATAVSGTTGLTTVQTFTISVVESPLYRIFVNFNGQSGAPAPWVNTSNGAPPAGTTFSNLKNESGTPSGVSMILQTAFGGYFDQGAQTGNNSGIVPDAVLKDYYHFGVFGSANDQYIKMTGLSPNNKYRFKFVSSSVWTNGGKIVNNGSTVYSIGSQTTSVNVQNNTSTFAIIENVVTNNVGEVLIHLSKGADATAGYINAMILEAFPVDPSRFDPTLLVAAGYSKTQVNLSWSDNSPVETGYEIYRSSVSQDGPFTLIKTTAADVSSYLDAVPSATTLYYYKVRAISGSGPSNYTNVATSGAVAFKLYINIAGTAATDAPAPWNNLSRFGFTGDIFTGFRNDQGQNTGIRFKVNMQVEAYNDFGKTTGNNSGVFPDNVMKSFWFNDAYFPKGEYVIDGLDQTYNYNFGFFGSISAPGTAVNTEFTSNGMTVVNRSDDNISNVSVLRNLKPDANGEILFTVKEVTGSPYSIFGALTIEGYAVGTTPTGGRVAEVASVKGDGNVHQVRYGQATDVTDIYPNPVRQQMNIDITDASIGQIEYRFFDMMGREVQQGKLNNDQVESAKFQINVDLPAAIYVMRLAYPNGRVETRKIIKE